MGPVVLAQVSLSFYAVTGAVVHAVLERLGHMVELREGPHEEMFPLLGEGSVDLLAAVWLPEGHAAYWSKYGSNAREVATLYDGAHFFWGVPDYLPREKVSSIADLATPEIAATMSRTIQGIGMGATISVLSQKAVVEYGLDKLGYTFRSGSQAEWIAAYLTAIGTQSWLVFPSWAPQYLNYGGKIRPIDDPRTVLGGVNRAVLVSPRERWSALPPRTQQVLSRIQLGIDGVTEMDWLVNARAMTPREAALQWMGGNRQRVDRWFV